MRTRITKDHPIHAGLKNTRVLQRIFRESHKEGSPKLDSRTFHKAECTCTFNPSTGRQRKAGGSRGCTASWSPVWAPSQTVSKTKEERDTFLYRHKGEPSKAKTKGSFLVLIPLSLLGGNRIKSNRSVITQTVPRCVRSSLLTVDTCPVST